MGALLALLCLTTKIALAAPAAPATPQNMTLKVMTFNVRNSRIRNPQAVPVNTWPQRRPAVKALLTLAAPDLIGTQEGIYHQLKDIAADHPEYDWIGLGRNGGSLNDFNRAGGQNEFMAIFYRKARFEPLDFDHFWLSDTPETMGSNTWGSMNIRMVTWVKFHDRQTGGDFYLWNTHLDHASQPAREKSAALILQRVKALETDLPILLTGDFNVAAGFNKVHDIFTQEGGFSDTWTSAARRLGPNTRTHHGYKPPVLDGRHIDWILSRGPVTTDSTEVLTFELNGQRPSDHFPVIATVRLGAPAKGSTPQNK